MRLFALICLAALCAACTEERRTSWEHGQATREIMASQVANPQAGGDAPVTGMDGVAAAKAVKTYREGDDKNKPQPQNASINLLMGGNK